MESLPPGTEDRVDVRDPLPGTTLGNRLLEVAGGGASESQAPLVVLVTGKVRRSDLARVTLALASSWVGESMRVAVVDLFLGDGVFVDPLAGERDEGLGDHLLFGSSFGVIERETTIPGLTLICAGAGSPDTESPLTGKGMEEFTRALRERFDAVFFTGAIPIAGEPRHPLLSWVDGWVGVGVAEEATGSELAASFGWVEVIPASAAPEPVAAETEKEKPAEPIAAVPVRDAGTGQGEEGPRRTTRPIYLVFAVVVLAAVVVWQLEPWAPSEPTRPVQEETTLFPKPEAPAQRREAVNAQAPETQEVESPDVRVTGEDNAAVREEIPAPPPATVAGTEAGTPVQPATPGNFAVHVSSYRVPGRAETEVRSLEAKGYEAEVVTVDLGDRGTWYRVWVGRLPGRVEAERLADELRRDEGFEYTRIVRRQ